MTTTIQVQDNTLLLLRKLKQYMNASSYDAAIAKIAVQTIRPKVSMAGSLRKYLRKGETSEDLIKQLQNERRKGWN